MLQYVQELNQVKDDCLSIPLISHDDFAALIKRKTQNLFPSQGPTKIRTMKNKQRKIDQLIKELEELKEFENVEDELSISEERNSSGIAENMDLERFHDAVARFKENCTDLKCMKKGQFDVPYKLDVSEADFRELCKNVSTVNKVS